MKNYYTYRFNVDGEIITYGITTDLKTEEKNLRLKNASLVFAENSFIPYENGRIEQIGCITSLAMAKKWLRKKSPIAP
ncbi:hypothetical protein ACFQ1M_08790 [Sungkyunkwania multivorans]|uniref:DUF2283 domain-containing protein n=1 Tax=Sungkyunkwania multivorans TaxID=1173618 RepID=A0ABW3D022_9FLAO